MTASSSTTLGPAETTESAESARHKMRFSRDEIPRLAGLFGFVALLHVAGFGLFYYYNSQSKYHLLGDSKGHLVFAGSAALAYGFGLRHAFDADHISAIDDTTRYLLQKGKRPLGVGFFFSLGHSSIVMALSIGIAFAAKSASHFQERFAGTGGIIGTLVSATFLYVIAAFNLVVLVGIIKMWRQAKAGRYHQEELDVLLANRGFMNRIFKGRYNKFINSSWQMYPVGVLFGLGFDTATEVGFLGLSATAAVAGTSGGTALPPLAIISLPLLFAAGMSLMDTFDGVFMSKAYGWAFVTPIRKIYYNITTTGLSIFVAFVIGTIEVLGLLSDKLALTGQPWDFINGIDINTAGRIIVGVFLVVWIGAVVYYKARNLDQRYADAVSSAASAEPSEHPLD
ncbi:MAG: HoxN/HupN/NixA family nickel/cobalt transporter [Actinomycetota bacterium]|nr:HoxN/HupN/NixA family nickel/cobalt transporter [Actinomycetota bacterium]MDQ2956471.1 HoxN/HupN/NixA family nickel/cobalt transporter [Actinomycetota bacterium]